MKSNEQSMMNGVASMSVAVMNRRRLLRGMGVFAALAAAGGRLAPASAQGMDDMATPGAGMRPDGSRLWRVQVAGGNMDEGIELMGFYPGEITINAGDAILFDFSAGMPEIPHTVSFLAAGAVPDLVVPAPPADGTPVESAVQRLMFNPEVAFPKGAQTVTGTTPVSSGMSVLMPAGSSYVLEFPTPGTYDYLDLVFPMVSAAKVTVLEKGAALPMTQEQYDSATSAQQTPRLDSAAKVIAQYSNPTPEDLGGGAGRWEVVTGATDGTTEVAAFVPNELKIKAGDTVRWTMEYSTLEVHTATFVGASAPPELLLIEPQGDGNPNLVLNPMLVMAAGDEVYPDGDYVNSGFISTRFPFPTTAELTFDEPGEYPYYCAIHGSPNSGMRGTIVVE